MKKSYLEARAECLFLFFGMYPEREYKFHQKRKWRFDFAFPTKKIAIEIEGGTFAKKSRHTSGSGYAADCEKYNTATMEGWKVIRYTGQMINVQNFETLKSFMQNQKTLFYDNNI